MRIGERAAAFWFADRLAEACGGRWVVPPARGPLAVRGVSIDSRSIAAGQAFVAIRGDRFDGHAFVAAAGERGAAMAIVDAADHPGVAGAPAGLAVLAVPDARRALGELASAYRGALDALVVAVTGSNGKTSTVRFLDGVLRGAGWRVGSSIKSFNNEIGVPLTILAAPADARALVCEVGMNAPGEIAGLARIVRPHAGVVTSIGRAHIGRLGSVAGIAREKLSLLRFLARGDDGRAPLALVPALGAEPAVVDLALDDLREGGWLRGVDLRRVRSGEGHGVRWSVVEEVEGGPDVAGGCDGCLPFRVEDDHGWGRGRGSGASAVFRAPVPGAAAAGNAALAVTVARWAGLDDEVIARGLVEAAAPEHRMSIADGTGPGGEPLRVIDDSYNASPESMLAALVEADRQARARGAARVLVLGEMGEMGAHAERVHREIGKALVDRGLATAGDWLVVVGGLAGLIAEEAGRIVGLEVARVASAGEELHETVGRAVGRVGGRGAVVLVKASRSVGLESVGGRVLRRS